MYAVSLTTQRRTRLMTTTSAPVIRVYEPALCCATGVCGPDLDQTLVQFTADLDYLKGQGVDIARFNLAIDPSEFAASPVVRDYLKVAGSAGLPLTLVDGVTVGTGSYLSRATLSRYAGLSAAAAPAADAPVVNPPVVNANASDESIGELCCTPEEAAATGCCADLDIDLDMGLDADPRPDSDPAAATSAIAPNLAPGLQLLPVASAGSCCGSTGGCC